MPNIIHIICDLPEFSSKSIGIYIKNGRLSAAIGINPLVYCGAWLSGRGYKVRVLARTTAISARVMVCPGISLPMLSPEKMPFSTSTAIELLA